jgi:ribosomal protein L31E
LWRDGTTSWERNLKESNPVQVADYAVANGINQEAAFAWWVPHTLHKRNRIVAAVNARYKKKNKFGIEIPKTVQCVLKIDRESSTDLWQKAIEKVMSQIKVAFNILDEGAIE